MTCNTITKNFALEELVFCEIKSASETVDMTAYKGEIDLLFDVTGASGASVTVCGGDYVGKAEDKTYALPAGTFQRISISSGETMKTDGCLHLTFANFAGLKVAVLGRRYVTNH